MKVAHLCLSCFYIDDRGYQENELVREHVVRGHEVLVLASTETHTAEGKLTYVQPKEYLGGEGARVVRLPYLQAIPKKIAPKLRAFSGVYRELEKFKPQVILFHGACAWELLTVARYVEENPGTLFYVDSHEDSNNSARSFVSREILHKIYYGAILRRVLPKVKKILCVTTESMRFVEKMYRIPPDCLEFYPLGGHPVADENYSSYRKIRREQLSIKEGDILMVQSGKQTRRKKLLETLRAFSKVPNSKIFLVVAGSLDKEIEGEALHLISEDERVRFIGWQTPGQLTSLLCAADVYLQPGTQSATMQHSLSCRCAVVLDDVPAHSVYYKSNGWLIKTPSELITVFKEIPASDVEAMKNISYSIAREMLDYRVLANRILA